MRSHKAHEELEETIQATFKLIENADLPEETLEAKNFFEQLKVFNHNIILEYCREYQQALKAAGYPTGTFYFFYRLEEQNNVKQGLELVAKAHQFDTELVCCQTLCKRTHFKYMSLRIFIRYMILCDNEVSIKKQELTDAL